MTYRVRLWFEYVNTKPNPADCLSRLGYDEPYASSQVNAGAWLPVHFDPPWEHIVGSLADVLSFILALGVSDLDMDCGPSVGNYYSGPVK